MFWSTIGSPQDGDSTVTSYSLEWDVGSEGQSWVREIGYLSNSLATTYTVTENIVIGKDYQFRLRAKNIWGWGAYSTISTIKAARVPIQMSAPATSVDADSGDLVISWTQPDPQGSAITSYFIEIAHSDGLAWSEYESTCNGEDPSLLECAVPMTDLALTYNYAQGALIKVRASAVNEFGASSVSDEN